MSAAPTLLEQVYSYENLFMAFHECSKGKKSKDGYRKYLFAYGEKLKFIEEEIRSTGNFRWGGYREFFVHDPKRRLVMAAPFRDRIVHTAIHRVIEPILDTMLGTRTFACRHGMGNRRSAIRLFHQLQFMGTERYCVKLDVKKYFESIPHANLLERISGPLPDQSLRPLLQSLLDSHQQYAVKNRGIPIGNLTSQLFANFYLRQADRIACAELGIDHGIDNGPESSCYLRYMDDMVILSKDKKKTLRAAKAAIECVNGVLDLEIPSYKVMVLASDPVPFLGFVFSESWYRPLRRNETKFIKKLKRLSRKKESLSLRAQTIQSYQAWQQLEV